MKYLLLFLLLFWGASTTPAQNESQGISAVIFSAPDKSEIKKFVSKDFEFSVDFVGEPKLNTKKFQVGSVTKFSTTGKGSNAVVKVYDLGKDTNIKTDTESVYKFFKDGYLAFPNSKLVSESDFTIEKIKGKEISIEAGTEFYKFRVLVIDGRAYEIYISVANWELINETQPKAREDFERESVRFFGSFKLHKNENIY